MRAPQTPLALARHRLGVASSAVVCAGLACSLGCIPSYPPNQADSALDRSQPCEQELPWPGIGLDMDGTLGLNACGYPAGEDAGGETGEDSGTYGFQEGQVVPNLILYDCEGTQVQLAQYLPQFGLANGNIKGIAFTVGALWCMPCRQEAMEWAADIVDAYPDIQLIQALDEGPVGLDSVTPESCAGWSAANVQDKFPILYDPNPQGLQSQIDQTGSGIPYTLILDVNATVRLRHVGGGILPSDTLEEQLDQLLGTANDN